MKYKQIRVIQKISIVVLGMMILSVFIPEIEIFAVNENDTGDFQVLGGTYGVDYEYKDVTYQIQGYGRENGDIIPKKGELKDLVVKVLSIKTSTPLIISTTKTTDDCIYIEPGNHADLTFDNVHINGKLPVNIPTHPESPTSLHLTLADGSDNSLQTQQNATAHLPGIRCGESSYLTIDDERRNIDMNGEFIAPRQGRVSRDATLLDGTIVKKGDRLTMLDSPYPGKLTVNGGYRAAAIGGAAIENSGNMTFNGGQIIARAFGPNHETYGAGTGIGGGHAGGGTTITVNGGNIEAYGSYHGAGFGGGCSYGHGVSGLSDTYTLNDAILCQTPLSTIAGDLNINGGFLRAEGFIHSNAFGQGCNSTNEGKTIKITGGTLLPVSKSGWYDIGGKGGDVIVTGGSIRLSGAGKFQGKNPGETYAWGDLGKTTQVFMTKIDLKGYNLPLTLVDSMKMSINGIDTDYGMPSYTDEKGALYFWLPESGSSSEVRVDLGIKDSDGNDFPLDSFFVTDAKQDSILKQYVSFPIDNSMIDEEKRLYKRYDGLSFTALQQQDFLNEAMSGGISVPIPSGGQLTDITKMSIQSQLLNNETLEPDSLEEIVTGINADVGKYQLIITSTEYAQSTGFKDSFWGHRAYYKYAEITPADTQSELTIDGLSEQPNIFRPDQTVTLKAKVSPANGEGIDCASPKGYVQFYINGRKYGEPVELMPHDKDHPSLYNYSIASIEWKDVNENYCIPGTEQTVAIEYIGKDRNYSVGSRDEKLLKIDNINIDVDGDNIPDINIDTDNDGKPDINIDIDNNYKPDINIDTDNTGEWKPSHEGGNSDGIWKPDTNIDTKGDGSTGENYYRPAIDINGDGIDDNWKPNIDVEYGEDNFPYDTYNPNINIDTDGDGDPDINIDTDHDGKPDVNIDTDGDNELDVNIDVDGDGIPDINIDTDKDGKPDINIDTDGDKKPNINLDTDNTGIWKPSSEGGNQDKIWKPDTNIDTNGNGEGDSNYYRPAIDINEDGIDDNWKPDQNVSIEDIDYDTHNPNINIDTDGDGEPDINIDTDGDGKPDINIDTDGDNKPDINIDTNGDGKPEINIDTDGDGKPDINIDTNGDGKPDINIDTDGDKKPDINIDVDGDGFADKNIDIKVNEHQIIKTNDTTSLMTEIVILFSSLLMIVLLNRRYQKNADKE